TTCSTRSAGRFWARPRGGLYEQRLPSARVHGENHVPPCDPFFKTWGTFASSPRSPHSRRTRVVVREALRWRDGPTASFGLSGHVTLASLGATRIIAAAGAGGLAVTYSCFRRARAPVARSLGPTISALAALVLLPPRRARARAGCRRVTSGACGVSSSCSPS